MKPDDLRAETRAEPTTGTLGTFAGVFTPSVLTILGIILFLRLGFVVGAAGLPRALLIVLLANLISISTSVSLSAVATNMRVKGGGDYYLISRTLGVEYGGALGLVLFLAQSVSIAFYAIGFGEAVHAVAGGPTWTGQAVAAGAIAVLFVLAWLGSDQATRFQYAVMVVLITAIVAFFVGGIERWDSGLLRGNLTATPVPLSDGVYATFGFWALFAIFFPAVTGFTQGVSMSGDLRDPGKSLPRGTFLAVFLSAVVYVGVAVVFAATSTGSGLVSDYNAMRRVSAVAWLVDAGVIAATLSSALASFLGAPRILQSLASDRVFPILQRFAIGHGPSNNPRNGVYLAALIAFVTVALGNLNVIAPIVSMFFLISYGLLNYGTWVEAQARSPYFRPRFRFYSKWVSLIGLLGCLGAMMAINPVAGAIALAVLFGLHQYVRRTVLQERWTDASRARLFQRVRDNLIEISRELDHPRDWRPVILAFSDDPERRSQLLRFAMWIEGGSGFTTVVRLVSAEGVGARKLQLAAERELRDEIDRLGVPAFGKAVATGDSAAAVPIVLQSYGLGRVKANTVLLNWINGDNGGPIALERFHAALRRALRYGSNIVFLVAEEEDFAAVEGTPPDKRRIDLWYRDNATGRTSLMLAYLMTRTELWSHATLRVYVRATAEKRDEALMGMRDLLDESRISAEVVAVDDVTPEIVRERSGDASSVFLPFRMAGKGPEAIWDGPLDETARALRLTALVLATADVPLDVAPEAGRHGELAEAADAERSAKASLEKIEHGAEEARQALESARKRLSAALSANADDEAIPQLETYVAKLEAETAKWARKLARGRAKVEQAKDAADPADPADNGSDDT